MNRKAFGLKAFVGQSCRCGGIFIVQIKSHGRSAQVNILKWAETSGKYVSKRRLAFRSVEVILLMKS